MSDFKFDRGARVTFNCTIRPALFVDEKATVVGQLHKRSGPEDYNGPMYELELEEIGEHASRSCFAIEHELRHQ